MSTTRRALLASLPLLPACVSVDIGQDAPAHAYHGLRDEAARAPEPRAQPLVPALLIQALPGDALAETASIAYSPRPHQYAYYQMASWTERPVRQVPRLLQRRLEARQVAAAVGVLGDPLRADWLLALTLDALYHDVSVQPGRAKVALGAELIDRRHRQRLAKRQFTADVAVERADSAAAALALSRALGQVFDALVPWLEAALPAPANSTKG